MSRLAWLLILAGLFGAGPVHGDWVPVQSAVPAAPQVKAVDTAAGTTRVELTLPGFDLATVTVDGAPHARVSLPGAPPTLAAGAPELPFVNVRLRLPDRGTPRVKILDAVWREQPVVPLLPSKGNLPRTADPADVPYTFGPDYAAGGVYPADVIEPGRPYLVRDARGLSLRVYPLRWDRDRDMLLVLESLSLEVTTAGDGGVNERVPRTRPTDRAFADLYDEAFDNVDPAAKYELITETGPMLVVCFDPLIEAVAEFVAWKQACGLPVEVLATSSVGGTREGIQTAISDRYFSPAGLTYVILVGDIDQVPTYSGDYEAADDDTRYGRLEGDDLYPDLFVSRISAETSAHVRVQTAKFIRYERDPDPDGDWYGHALGAASSESGDSDLTDFQRADLLRGELLDYDFTAVDRIYMPAATSADMTAAMNAGRSLIYYIGHGSGAAWSAPYFGLADVAALANGWANPWIIDVSCSNGDFSQSECFAELWMRVGTPFEPQGAIAVYSSSTVTPWVPPCLMQTEAIDLLVTDRGRSIGSLLQHGIMRVLDAYPGEEGLQLVEQYNIFGDCSLQVRTRKPRPLQVEVPGSLTLGQDHLFVQTNRPGLTVALTGDGLLRGSAVTDAAGQAEIHLDHPAGSVGPVTLTVTGTDVLTHTMSLPVELPGLVALSADTLTVGETVDLAVTVSQPWGASSEGLQVQVEGHGLLEPASAVTDALGQATVSLQPLCGETLTVRVFQPGSPADLARRPLVVTGALDLTDPVLTAAVPAAGLSGRLVPGLPGRVTGQAGEELLTLKLITPDETLYAGWGADSLATEFTPAATGDLTAVLVKSGYNVVSAVFPVEPVLTPMTGTVTALSDGALLSEALVRLFAPDDPVTPVAEALTGPDGVFAIHSPVPVAPYELKVTRYGYTTLLDAHVPRPGPVPLDIVLATAPPGAVTGQVLSGDDQSPVSGTVELLRGDTGQKVTQVFTDPVNGTFRLDGVPWFEYRLRVTAHLFLPWETAFTLADTLAVVDPRPNPAAGNILVLQDDLLPNGSLVFPVKRDKTGAILAPSHVKQRSSAALDILVDLMGHGYGATYLPLSAAPPSTWTGYDLLVYSCGNSYDNLAPDSRGDLLDYLADGGRLLLEGGEVAYVHRRDPDLAGRVMRMDGWTGDAAEYFSLAADDDLLQGAPHLIEGQLVVDNSSYGDVDQLDAADAARVPGVWGLGEWDAVTCRDADPDPVGGQVVFFAFDYASLDVTRRADLLQNAVEYLLATPPATAAVSGSVAVAGDPDASGVTLRLEPGGHFRETGPDGSFTLDDLVAGDYRLTATRAGLSAAVRTVSLADGQLLDGLDLTLSPVLTADVCDAPALPVPDGDPVGVSTVLAVSLGSRVSGLAVQVDLAHPRVEEVTLELTSPVGTSVRLHHRQTGDAAGLTGWFPVDLPTWDELDLFLGEETDGDWTLRLVDGETGDTGALNAWCLRLAYEAVPSAAGDEAPPRPLTLLGNRPNPFNPSTEIAFLLPSAGPVDLAVYDLSGRRLRTLVTGRLDAGRHAVTWDGRDDTGRALASGTYFQRLVAGAEVRVGKMVLLK